MRWWLPVVGVVLVAAAGCSSASGSHGAGGVATTPTAATAGEPSLPVVRFARAGGAAVALYVEVADDSDEQTCGLMHRSVQPDEQGMLFVFAVDSFGGFWMRNTLIPLSIAYADAGGRIVDILEMQPVSGPNQTPYRLADGRQTSLADGTAPPPGATVVTYNPRAPYRYAIEANQGWFTRNGIQIGDSVDVQEAVAQGDQGTPPAICRQLGT